MARLRLAKLGLFATPDNVEALTKYVISLPEDVRTVAITVMGMTWNLCSEITSEGGSIVKEATK